MKPACLALVFAFVPFGLLAQSGNLCGANCGTSTSVNVTFTDGYTKSCKGFPGDVGVFRDFSEFIRFLKHSPSARAARIPFIMLSSIEFSELSSDEKAAVKDAGKNPDPIGEHGEQSEVRKAKLSKTDKSTETVFLVFGDARGTPLCTGPDQELYFLSQSGIIAVRASGSTQQKQPAEKKK